MKVARPRLPAGAPSGRARTMNTSASTLEQKCLSPEEQPLVAVLHGPGGVGPDVAAALALGEEHPALPRLVGVEAAQPAARRSSRPPSRGVALDDVGGARRSCPSPQ